MVLITTSCTVLWTFIHSSLDLNPWICLSLPLYTLKGVDSGHTWMSWGLLPCFLQFKSEFGNKEFMIRVTVSSWSCFCWVYRVSPCLAAKNIITLVSVLTIWWCPCVELSLVLAFPGGSNGDKSACKAKDLDSIPGLEDPLDKGMATQSNILA